MKKYIFSLIILSIINGVLLLINSYLTEFITFSLYLIFPIIVYFGANKNHGNTFNFVFPLAVIPASLGCLVLSTYLLCQAFPEYMGDFSLIGPVIVMYIQLAAGFFLIVFGFIAHLKRIQWKR